ncbi:integrase catalytic domain-containing protein [Trichonephila clavipes]|nr:integrase catalytic domain-containing protein [Trichonephila clavipes]
MQHVVDNHLAIVTALSVHDMEGFALLYTMDSSSKSFSCNEKAFQIKSVPDELKAEILLNILGERVNNLLTYVSQEDLSNYVKIKELILREFEPTPQECLDKIFETLDRDMMNHIATKQGETYFKPQQLGRECDVYLSTRGKVSNDLMSRNPGSGVKTDGRYRLQTVGTWRREKLIECFRGRNQNKLCSILKECRSEKNCFCLRPHNSLIHFSRDKTRNPTPTSNLNLDAPTFVPGQIEGSVEANSQSQFVATGRNCEGRYVVSMALNKDPSCLGNSKDIAIRRLNSLWKRLSRDSSYLSLYAEFLKEYEELGHLERVVESSEPPTHYYIPHHGVLRPEKLTTKLRIVFNGVHPPPQQA